MVDGQKTNRNGDSLLVSLQSPYKNVIEVTGFDVAVKGETKDTYYRKDFRWSTDGILYGDWKELTSENLQSLLLDSDKEFWPQYRFTQVGDGELEFVSISLEITAMDGTINSIPLCGVNDNSVCCGQQNLVFDCCNDGFNPYAVGNSSAIYTQLCQVVSNMFGFCVQYFKTKADQRSKDVILHEYSLENVIAQGNVKILVPDNALPTREINFNPLMMDYPTIFEVQIVKSDFRSAFGADAKPEVHDYLYFETYMNKMYEVNAVSETDDYLYTGAYWRVSLVQYQQRSAVGFDTEELDVATHTLLFDTDKFNIEVEKQEKDARKPDQYNTIGKTSNDYVRRILNKKLVIESKPVYHNWTVIAKNYYALGSVGNLPKTMEYETCCGTLERRNEDTVLQYRYDKGWGSGDERQLTVWFRPNYSAALGNNVAIEEMFEDSGRLGVVLASEARFSPGDYVRLSHTNYDATQRVRLVDYENRTLILDTAYIDNILNVGGVSAKLRPMATNRFFGNGGFSLVQTAWSFIVEIGGDIYAFDTVCEKATMLKDVWYAAVVAVKPDDGKIAFWLYELGDGTMQNRGMDSKLKQVFYECRDAVGGLDVADGNWELYACDMDLTNIRIWNSICEEDLHNLILSQYVVRDSHLCELVDNAQPELMLDRVTNPR